MKLTATNVKPGRFVIVCKTAKQFFDAVHRIESGGWRWWRITQKLPGPEKHIETNMPDETHER